VRRTGGHWKPPEVFAAQCRASSRLAWEESASVRRLAATFAEEDAEIAARLGEDIMGEDGLRYKFVCRFCKSRFSLELQRDTHEEQCGLVDAPAASPPAESSIAPNGRRPITCKHCEHVSPGLKEHAAHLLEAHREETLARRRQLAEHRKAEDARIDAGESPGGKVCKRCGYRAENFGDLGRHMRQEHPEAYRNHAQVGADPGRNALGTPGAPPVQAPRLDPVCPTCGGQLPQDTAQLVAELLALGISETQAFAATQAARRTFGVGRSAA
jgi:hypothetical protein